VYDLICLKEKRRSKNTLNGARKSCKVNPVSVGVPGELCSGWISINMRRK